VRVDEGVDPLALSFLCRASSVMDRAACAARRISGVIVQKFVATTTNAIVENP
jgi:hypothetical protein